MTWTRDGYVALLPISLPSTAQVQHQDLSSEETVGEKRKRTGRTVPCNAESGEKLIKEEGVEDVCARPHSADIRLYGINEVNKDSTEEEDNNRGNQTDNEMTVNDTE